MVRRITLDLLRKRAEHNDGHLSSLQEVGLHQQGIEKIELLGHACRHLKILYLQGNVIGKLENLHRLKELDHLNLALNNITKVQNLQKCESLRKLDLTANFIDKTGLPTVRSLQHNSHLRELYLMGNPCAQWGPYRPYIIANIPQLHSLDGKAISASERIEARQALPEHVQALRNELAREGIDMDEAAAVDDDSLCDQENIPETGHMNEDGRLVRPWCPATRLLEQRETEAENAQAEEAKRAGMRSQPASSIGQPPPRREDFPPLPDGDRVMQCNEGKWDFKLIEPERGGTALILEVTVGPHIDSSLIKADVQPLLVRVLIKGRLLQLELPQEVSPDNSTAQRSSATDRLVVTMPLATAAGRAVIPLDGNRHAAAGPHTAPGKSPSHSGRRAQAARGGKPVTRPVAAVLAFEVDDNDLIPEL